MRDRKRSIRQKLFVIMVGLILALLTTLTFIHHLSQKTISHQELDRRIEMMRSSMKIHGKTVSDNLARFTENAIGAFDFFSITQTLETVVKEDKDIIYGILMDSTGMAHIHTQNPDLLETKLTSQADKFALQQKEFAFHEFEQNGVSFLEFITPIFIGDVTWGVLRLGFSLTSLQKEIFNSRLRMKEQLENLLVRSVSITFLFVFVGGLLVVYGARRITKPLQQLTKFSGEIAEGDFDAKVPESATRSNDEIGELACTFRDMAVTLKTSYEQLEDYSQTLEQKVDERTSELKITNKHLQQEIVERKRVEEELEKAKESAISATLAKSEFLATMSHEIRTPMNAIVGMADLLWETQLNSEQEEYVQIFRTAGDNLLQIINDILDFSKIEAGQIELENVDLDLYELVEKTGEVLSFRAHEKGLELSCHVSPDVPTTLMGDPVRLRQILVNLIGNAIKFTQKGEVVLHVKNDPNSTQTGTLLFSVSDTGIGIPQEKLSEVFERFFQADSSTSRKYGGTGLGLAITKRLVELMGGRIWTESEAERGSTFYFIVKFGVRPEAQKSIAVQRIDLKNVETLVVDDNATNRLILREILSGWSAPVADAASGELGLAELKRAKYAGEFYKLLLLDCRMPDMDGFQVAEHIKKDPELAGVTIMMLTSDNRSGDSAKARELGITAFVVKPIKRADLLNIISSTLGKTKEHGQTSLSMPPQKQIIYEYLHPLRILLVEDYLHNRIVIQSYLKKTPFTIDIAENGKIGVEKFESGKYDLLLMDLQMPVMDGYTAVKKIRKYEKENGMKATPVIALTAYALKSDMEKSLKAGCDDHLSKPVKKSELLAAIIKHTSAGDQINKAEKEYKKNLVNKDRVADHKGKTIVYVDADFKDTVPKFFGDVQNDIKSMMSALNNGDYKAIRTIGHRLKGAGGGYGFDVITDIGRAIEKAAEEMNQEEIRKRLNEFSNHLESVEVIYLRSKSIN